VHTHWCLIVDTPIRFTVKYFKKATGKFTCLQKGRCQRKRESADERGESGENKVKVEVEVEEEEENLEEW